MEQLTKNNASLTAQISELMKINLDMAKNLDIKAAQVKDPEGKILVDKANRNAAFERNLDPEGYCWTHGFRVTKRHSSQTCSTPAGGHQNTATQKKTGGQCGRQVTQRDGGG